jgi:hypothetical protein
MCIGREGFSKLFNPYLPFPGEGIARGFAFYPVSYQCVVFERLRFGRAISCLCSLNDVWEGCYLTSNKPHPLRPLYLIPRQYVV